MNGAWLMFSMPPATQAVASPMPIAWQADTIDWMPLPHRRFTVRAGVVWGMPALRPTWRAP